MRALHFAADACSCFCVLCCLELLIKCSRECDLCDDGLGLVVWYWRIRSAAGVPFGLGFEAYSRNRCCYGVLMLSLAWCRLLAWSWLFLLVLCCLQLIQR